MVRGFRQCSGASSTLSSKYTSALLVALYLNPVPPRRPSLF
jgi:hypothetical protein